MDVGKSATDVEIFKPRIDKHEYRRIILSNSLEALLISDPDIDKILVFAEFAILYKDFAGIVDDMKVLWIKDKLTGIISIDAFTRLLLALHTLTSMQDDSDVGKIFR
ncbi:uncharacterized protein A4U43_C04F14060 [Asparagus officinalis]|uniref:Uncharacterized protein n=1 Tax=Asparagus officinalis TaxID=4686 RepID=A0A5P1F5E6_ASPOF|nr:uncharacterized protein A4U43_C04F14060 [Asparagus officinalis]